MALNVQNKNKGGHMSSTIKNQNVTTLKKKKHIPVASIICIVLYVRIKSRTPIPAARPFELWGHGDAISPMIISFQK